MNDLRPWGSVSILAAVACLGATSGCARNPELAKRQYVASGDQYVAHQKYQEAALEYRNAIQQDSRFAEARLKLAEVSTRLGDTAQATREFVAAADLMPQDVAVQLEACQALLGAGKYEDAKIRADQALALDPRSVQAEILKGTALAGLKNLDAAVKEIQAAIALDPAQGTSYAALGAFELARGNHSEAEAAFKRAVDLDPTSAAARLSLAKFYWIAHQLPEAEQVLKDALSLDATNVAANQAMAALFLATNRAPGAERYLLAVAKATNATADKLALADYYIRLSRPDDARTVLYAAMASDAASFVAIKLRLASMAVSAHQTSQAQTLVGEALAREPKNVDALVAKARLLIDARKYDDALATLGAAANVDARALRVQLALADVRAARHEWDQAIAALNAALADNPGSVDAHIKLSAAYLGKGNRDRAIQSAQDALDIERDNPQAQFALSRALLANADASQAAPHVDRLSKAFPESPEIRTQVGTLALLKKNPKAARDAFEHALAVDPHETEALASMTRLDLQSGKGDAARARIEARLKTTSDDPQLLILAALTYGALKDKPSAERVLQQALAVDPANLHVYALLAQLYASENRLDDARHEFERATELRPDSVGARTMVALILDLQHKPAEARAAYEKVLNYDPRAAVAANNLAWIYADAGENLDRALQLAQTAKTALPDDPQVADTLGWVYYKKGLSSLAIGPLEESVAAAPQTATFAYHLGLAYAQAGDGAEARKSFDRALALQPAAAEATQIRAALTSLPQ